MQRIYQTHGSQEKFVEKKFIEKRKGPDGKSVARQEGKQPKGIFARFPF
jgi:hypothetical protein